MIFNISCGSIISSKDAYNGTLWAWESQVFPAHESSNGFSLSMRKWVILKSSSNGILIFPGYWEKGKEIGEYFPKK